MHAGLDLEIEIEPAKLIDQARNLILCGITEPITITVGPARDFHSAGTPTALGALLVPVEVWLGVLRISSVVGFVGEVQADGDADTVTVAAVPDVLATIVKEADEPVSQVDAQDLCQSAVRQLQKRGVTGYMAPPGFTELVRNGDPG